MFRLGEDDIKSETESEKIEIVSASRSEKLRDDLPVTVYVISREEIIKMIVLFHTDFPDLHHIR